MSEIIPKDSELLKITFTFDGGKIKITYSFTRDAEEQINYLKKIGCVQESEKDKDELMLCRDWRMIDPFMGILQYKGIYRGQFIINYDTTPWTIEGIEWITRYHVADFVASQMVCVVDHDNTIVKELGKAEYGTQEYYKLYQKGYEFLDANYPDWKNPNAYWDSVDNGIEGKKEVNKLE